MITKCKQLMSNNELLDNYSNHVQFILVYFLLEILILDQDCPNKFPKFNNELNYV